MKSKKIVFSRLNQKLNYFRNLKDVQISKNFLKSQESESTK